MAAKKKGFEESMTRLEEIVDELERMGLLENTVVVYTSDHGSALFDNEQLHKGCHFPTQAVA